MAAMTWIPAVTATMIQTGQVTTAAQDNNRGDSTRLDQLSFQGIKIKPYLLIFSGLTL